MKNGNPLWVSTQLVIKPFYSFIHINPLSPNIDQDQFSLNNKVSVQNQEKRLCFDLLSNSLN